LTPPKTSKEQKKSTEAQFKYWRKRILITAWITYSTFYLCRVNLSVAIPGIAGELGYSKALLGSIATALLATYACGQFVSGQLGDKFGARKIVAVGIFGSAILNMVFGFSTGITMMIIVWGLNGIFQSMGWAPTVKTIASWFPGKMRGKVGGILGTSYILGNAYSWVLAGFVAGLLGWRWCFWIPAIIFLISGVHWYTRSRNTPEDIGLPESEDKKAKSKEDAKKCRRPELRHTVMLCLKHPMVWCGAFALLFLNIVRYGFTTWMPTYLREVGGLDISSAALQAAIIPLAGCLGALTAGWISDKLFHYKRGPIAAIMLFILTVVVFVFPYSPAGSLALSVAGLFLIGFMSFGPHVLIVGIIPMDVGTRTAAASVAGFIDGFGYIGAAVVGAVSGLLIDLYGWSAAFYFWVISAAIAGVLMVVMSALESRTFKK